MHTGAPLGTAPPKDLKLYVGKIAPTVQEPVIRKLLEACGPIRNWKLMEGDDGKHRGFGFCEFADAEGMQRAVGACAALMGGGFKRGVACRGLHVQVALHAGLGSFTGVLQWDTVSPARAGQELGSREQGGIRPA